MRVFSSSYTFDYSWDEVSTANWRKYCPWNKASSHVIAVDTLSRHVDPSTGILRTERLITCRQPAPAFVNTLLGGQCETHSYETSYVDPIERKVTMVSENLTWSNMISVRETVSYIPDTVPATTSTGTDDNPSNHDPSHSYSHERTRFEQEARVTALCGGWQRMKIKIEEVTVDRFRENARRGREGFEAVLEMSRRAFGEEKMLQKQQQQVEMQRQGGGGERQHAEG